MIKAITVINSHREKARFELSNPRLNDILITKIEGLGPPKAIINTLKVATFDGSIFNSSKLDQRDLVITFRPLPGLNIENSRLLLYKMFPIKGYVTVVVETDNRIGGISGYVESNEPDIFNSGETIQISILCPDPYFKEYDDNREKMTTISTSSPKPIFEFPFDNNSLEMKLLEMGSAIPSGDAIVNYKGDGISHPIFKFTFIENVIVKDKFLVIKKIVPYASNPIQMFAVDMSKYKGTVANGDSLEIDCRPGHKSVRFIKHMGEYTVYQDIHGSVPFTATIGNVTFNNEWPTIEYGESSFNSKIVNPFDNIDNWSEWISTTSDDGISIFAETSTEELPLYIQFDIEFRPIDELDDCWAMFISKNTDPNDLTIAPYTYSKITDCLNAKMYELYSGSDAIASYDYNGNQTYKFSPRILKGMTIHIETDTSQSFFIGQVGSSIGLKKLGIGGYQYRVNNVQTSRTPFSIPEEEDKETPFALDISYHVLYGGM